MYPDTQFSEIPVEPGSLYTRRYNNMDFYIRSANLSGSYFAYILDSETSRYFEFWIMPGTTAPNWQYNRGYGWRDSLASVDIGNYNGNSYRYSLYLDEAGSVISPSIHIFTSMDEALEDFFGRVGYPITYRPTNCTFPNAPTEAAVGDTVTVTVAFEEGYGIVNPSDIYVTCNGVAVPSTYNNGTLTFTMPDPS